MVVVIVILGVLAAVALPRFINMGTEARIASLNALKGTLWSAATQAHSACALSSNCDINTVMFATVAGHVNAAFEYGWPDAGDFLGNGQIDDWINYSGFTASVPDTNHTVFTLDGAPTPATCSVSYQQAFVPAGPTITITTTGC